jgi:glycine betaine/proline transport system ATP-binding protein
VFFVADGIEAAPMNGLYAAREQDDVIECRRVWKVFGADGQVSDVRKWRELSKSAIADKFKCIVGVADVSFSVRRGEIFCIMGLSGSGKSTLVRHINRLINPTSGEILVNGERVDLMRAEQLRKLRNQTVGMVFQHVALLPHRTVRDNVAFPLELRLDAARKRQEIADAKLNLVHLAGWGDRYPDELSGGMQQRVGLARALAADPDILLMDEPFSALDPLIRRRLQDQFLELSRQLRKTTVFITHDLEEALKLGDRIAIMRDGRFVQIGRPEEIVASPADDYVADFVRGMPRFKLLRASQIMRPLEDHRDLPGGASEAPTYLSAAPDATLEQLIDLMILSPNPILIRNGGGRPIGIVDVPDVLRTIRSGVTRQGGDVEGL